MLQCIAVCCVSAISALLYYRDLECVRVAVCCSVLQCVALPPSVLLCCIARLVVCVCCSVFHCVAVGCSVLRRVAVFCIAATGALFFQHNLGCVCVAVCCSVSQCVALCCDVLHCLHLYCNRSVAVCCSLLYMYVYIYIYIYMYVYASMHTLIYAIKCLTHSQIRLQMEQTAWAHRAAILINALEIAAHSTDIHLQNSSMYTQKSPTNLQKRPTYPQKSPVLSAQTHGDEAERRGSGGIHKLSKSLSVEDSVDGTHVFAHGEEAEGRGGWGIQRSLSAGHIMDGTHVSPPPLRTRTHRGGGGGAGEGDEEGEARRGSEGILRSLSYGDTAKEHYASAQELYVSTKGPFAPAKGPTVKAYIRRSHSVGDNLDVTRVSSPSLRKHALKGGGREEGGGGGGGKMYFEKACSDSALTAMDREIDSHRRKLTHTDRDRDKVRGNDRERHTYSDKDRESERQRDKDKDKDKNNDIDQDGYTKDFRRAVSAKEPYVSSQKPYVSTKEPCIPAKESTMKTSRASSHATSVDGREGAGRWGGAEREVTLNVLVGNVEIRHKQCTQLLARFDRCNVHVDPSARYHVKCMSHE